MVYVTWHLVVPCGYFLLLLCSLLFRRGMTQVLLPWGSWEADRARQGVKGDRGCSRGYYLSAGALGGPDTWVRRGFMG